MKSPLISTTILSLVLALAGFLLPAAAKDKVASPNPSGTWELKTVSSQNHP